MEMVLPGQVEVYRRSSTDLKKSDFGLGLRFSTFYFDFYYVVLGQVGSFLALCEMVLGW